MEKCQHAQLIINAAVRKTVAQMIKVNTGKDEVKTYDAGITVEEVISNVLVRKNEAVAATVDGIERDLSYALDNDCQIEPIIGNSDAGLYILRHSCAHLLAQALTEIFPDAKPTIGPPIEHGFYYDFNMEPISEDELSAIEKRMKKLARQNLKIEREVYDNSTLRKMFSNNQFKIEIMDDKIGHDVGSSAYRQGDFVDLCRGPHVSTLSLIHI